MSAGALLTFAVFLALATLAGAAALVRVLPRDEDADAAVALGPSAGLLLAALPGWLLSAAVRVPAGLVLALGAAAWAAALGLGARPLLRLLARPRRLLVPLAVPLAATLLFLWLRWPAGAIRDTEKPMDFAVLSAAMTTPSLPLGDPWLSGERFSYYHLGTLALALPARAAGLPSEDAYNLLAALLAGLAASAAFAAGRLRGGGRRLALAASAALVLAGTFDGARQLLAGTPVGGIDLWASSRRVAHAITEWPLFTLRLGDLHPHAVALPLLVAWAGAAGRLRGASGVAAQGLLLGSLLATNPWDAPAALLVLAAGTLARDELLPAVKESAATLLAAVPVLLPFLLGPRPPFLGLSLSPAATTSPEAFLHLGPFVAVPALALGVALVRSQDRPDRQLLFAVLPPTIGVALSIVSQRPVLGLALGFASGVALVWGRLAGTLRSAFLLASAGALLASVPEVIVVLDPYGDDYRRMNTLFKTWAGAVPLLVVASALLLPLALAARRGRRTIRALLLATLAGALVHPAAAVATRLAATGGGLDGLSALAAEAPGDVAAIRWLREHAPADAVVAEAPGEAYSLHGRISSATGRPTVLGWASHEGIWRGSAAREEIEARKAALKTLYTSADAAAVGQAVRTYGIRYVVVGPLERKDFGPGALRARALFTRVLDADGTELFEVRAP